MKKCGEFGGFLEEDVWLRKKIWTKEWKVVLKRKFFVKRGALENRIVIFKSNRGYIFKTEIHFISIRVNLTK